MLYAQLPWKASCTLAAVNGTTSEGVFIGGWSSGLGLSGNIAGSRAMPEIRMAGVLPALRIGVLAAGHKSVGGKSEDK